MFDLSSYETVEERLVKFWEKYPDGRIDTELIEATANRFIVKSYLFRTEADAKPWTTGLAFEMVTDRGVNATSALENCETSSIGRALANAGFATRGKRASREEMTKVAVRENDKEAAKAVVGITSDDDWDSFVGKVKDDDTIISLAEAMDLVQSSLGGSTVKSNPMCAHGAMIPKSGVSAKTGKPYSGWVCSGNGTQGNKCPAVWNN